MFVINYFLLLLFIPLDVALSNETDKEQIHLSELPIDILTKIIDNVNSESLLNFSLTSKQNRCLAKVVYNSKSNKLGKFYGSKRKTSKEIDCFASNSQLLKSTNYVNKYTIDITRNDVSEIKILKDGNIIIIYGNGTTEIRDLINPNDNHLISTLPADDSHFVTPHQMDNRTLVAHHKNGTMRVWTPNSQNNGYELTSRCENALGLDSPICSRELSNGIFASPVSNNVYLYDLSIDLSPPPLNILHGHTRDINQLLVLKDGRLVSVSRDKTLKIWAIKKQKENKQGENKQEENKQEENKQEENKQEEYEYSRTLKGSTAYISTVIELKDGRIIAGHYNGLLSIWDLNRPEETACVTENRYGDSIELIKELKDGRILFVSKDNSVVVWDPSNPDINTNVVKLPKRDTTFRPNYNPILELDDGSIAYVALYNITSCPDRGLSIFTLNKNDSSFDTIFNNENHLNFYKIIGYKNGCLMYITNTSTSTSTCITINILKKNKENKYCSIFSEILDNYENKPFPDIRFHHEKIISDEVRSGSMDILIWDSLYIMDNELECLAEDFIMDME